MLSVKGQKVDPIQICNNVKEKPEKLAVFLFLSTTEESAIFL